MSVWPIIVCHICPTKSGIGCIVNCLRKGKGKWQQVKVNYWILEKWCVWNNNFVSVQDSTPWQLECGRDRHKLWSNYWGTHRILPTLEPGGLGPFVSTHWGACHLSYLFRRGAQRTRTFIWNADSGGQLRTDETQA